jgi:hypothetical protein
MLAVFQDTANGSHHRIFSSAAIYQDLHFEGCVAPSTWRKVYCFMLTRERLIVTGQQSFCIANSGFKL